MDGYRMDRTILTSRDMQRIIRSKRSFRKIVLGRIGGNICQDQEIKKI